MTTRGRGASHGRRALLNNPRDNVATALAALPEGGEVHVGGVPAAVSLRAAIPMGHKFALCDFPAGAPVIKYGQAVGVATRAIARGEHVHVHNVASGPRDNGAGSGPGSVGQGQRSATRTPPSPTTPGKRQWAAGEGAATFQGYRRPDGRAGTRNLVLVIPSVGCSQGAARAIARGLRSAVCLPNVLGCGQVGPDPALVERTLVGFGTHPNAFAVLVVGNGCEHLSPRGLAEEIARSGKRVETVVLQELGGTRKTVARGRKILREMLADAAGCEREPIPLSELILGTECGGSDFSSGLAANPAVGAASDLLVAGGGTVLLSETPELIGAERLFAARARTPEVARQVLDAVAWWEARAGAAGQNIREVNPSPGNIAGGITTLEEKSLGCIAKGGTGPLEEVVPYGVRPTREGLVYMDTPAHDIEQLTGMVAGGAQVVVFTTGRGTPCGSPLAPVLKVTANPDTYRNQRDDLDFNASRVLAGRESVEAAGERLLEEIVAVASGKRTKAEKHGQQDFGIFQTTLNI